MDSADLLGVGKVRDGSRDAQHPVEAARREPHRGGCIRQQLAPRLVGCRDLVEEFAVCLCVGSRAMAVVTVRTSSRDVQRASVSSASATCSRWPSNSAAQG